MPIVLLFDVYPMDWKEARAMNTNKHVIC